MSVRGFPCTAGEGPVRAAGLLAKQLEQPSFVKGQAVRIADPTQPASQTPLTRHGDGVHALTP